MAQILTDLEDEGAKEDEMKWFEIRLEKMRQKCCRALSPNAEVAEIKNI